MEHRITPSVRNSTIVICGASSGFGRAAALELAGQGARTVLVARRQEALIDLVIQIHEAGGEAVAIAGDVSRAEDVAAVAATAVEDFGGIDTWINNAGIGALGLFWDIPLEDQVRVIDVNLKGLMFGAHTALGRFREQGHGVLINVGSVGCDGPIAYQTVYAATKAAVLSLSRSLNEELRLAGLGDAIRVAAVLPETADTPLWTHAANYTGRAPMMGAMSDPALAVQAIVRACTAPEDEIAVGSGPAVGRQAPRSRFPGHVARHSAILARGEIPRTGPAAPTSGSIYLPDCERRPSPATAG